MAVRMFFCEYVKYPNDERGSYCAYLGHHYPTSHGYVQFRIGENCFVAIDESDVTQEMLLDSNLTSISYDSEALVTTQEKDFIVQNFGVSQDKILPTMTRAEMYNKLIKKKKPDYTFDISKLESAIEEGRQVIVGATLAHTDFGEEVTP